MFHVVIYYRPYFITQQLIFLSVCEESLHWIFIYIRLRQNELYDEFLERVFWDAAPRILAEVCCSFRGA